ncbi:hypothetical protein [Kitasatospora sp. NPDC085879]|uniref:hypothetical protein n=1 Tax=Kitasatospora sp. NPDC085879 TaxID=3154769 RepID=UPI000BB15FCF|nr:hypothetical protein [Streptomyces sp. TLI_235]PBC69761.1 hypothetical protein BX265_7113 [Streptomyces sp. TLI_235]
MRLDPDGLFFPGLRIRRAVRSRRAVDTDALGYEQLRRLRPAQQAAQRALTAVQTVCPPETDPIEIKVLVEAELWEAACLAHEAVRIRKAQPEVAELIREQITARADRLEQLATRLEKWAADNPPAKKRPRIAAPRPVDASDRLQAEAAADYRPTGDLLARLDDGSTAL